MDKGQPGRSRAPHYHRGHRLHVRRGVGPEQVGKGCDDEFHVGPHIMIVSPHDNQKELQSISHDGSTGMPYVAHLPHGDDLYLVLPFREWGEK